MGVERAGVGEAFEVAHAVANLLWQALRQACDKRRPCIGHRRGRRQSAPEHVVSDTRTFHRAGGTFARAGGVPGAGSLASLAAAVAAAVVARGGPAGGRERQEARLGAERAIATILHSSKDCERIGRTCRRLIDQNRTYLQAELVPALLVAVAVADRSLPLRDGCIPRGSAGRHVLHIEVGRAAVPLIPLAGLCVAAGIAHALADGTGRAAPNLRQGAARAGELPLNVADLSL